MSHQIGQAQVIRRVTEALYATLGDMPDPVIRITVDGKLALTLDQAAERVGHSTDTVRREISRKKLAPVAQLDAKKKLYGAKEFDAMWKGRPGIGSPGKRRGKAE